jgi:hypothetical protein
MQQRFTQQQQELYIHQQQQHLAQLMQHYQVQPKFVSPQRTSPAPPNSFDIPVSNVSIGGGLFPNANNSGSFSAHLAQVPYPRPA